MNGAIDWKSVYISADGRLGRAPFWITAGIILAAVIVYEAVAGGALQLVTGWFVYPLALYFGACVLSKRLHDRGRSGWYAAPILMALIGVWSSINSVLDAVFLVILIWAVVELAVLQGEQGANRFGANPMVKPA